MLKRKYIWFAWYPVKTTINKFVWLKKVKRFDYEFNQMNWSEFAII